MILTIGRIERRRKARCAKAIERIEGPYESEKAPFGRVYRWRPGCVVAECGRGERAPLAGPMAT